MLKIGNILFFGLQVFFWCVLFCFFLKIQNKIVASEGVEEEEAGRMGIGSKLFEIPII